MDLFPHGHPGIVEAAVPVDIQYVAFLAFVNGHGQPLGGAAETQQGNAGGIVAVNALQGLGEDGAVVGIQHKFLAVQPRHELVKGFPIRI